MASYTTGLKEFSNNGNSVTFVIDGEHTANEPRLVIQKRRVAEGNRQYYEMDMNIVHGLLDSDSLPVATKLSSEVRVKVPTLASSTDVDDLLAHLRDFVASDEFTASVKQQLWLL